MQNIPKQAFSEKLFFLWIKNGFFSILALHLPGISKLGCKSQVFRRLGGARMGKAIALTDTLSLYRLEWSTQLTWCVRVWDTDTGPAGRLDAEAWTSGILTFVLTFVFSPCLLWAEWEFQTKLIREALALSHKVQKGPPCSLNSFSGRSLCVVDSLLALDFVNGLCLKDYIGVIDSLYNFVLHV